MDILRIRSFVTVARLGNVTRAAEALHLTRSKANVHAVLSGVELNVTQEGDRFVTKLARQIVTLSGLILDTAPQAEEVLQLWGSGTIGTNRD